MVDDVRLRSDNHWVRRVDSLTIDTVRKGKISRIWVGTGNGPEFVMYVGTEAIFLVSALNDAPRGNSFPEGHVYVTATQKELEVGSTFTIDQIYPFLSLKVTRFVITYIEIPYLNSGE